MMKQNLQQDFAKKIEGAYWMSPDKAQRQAKEILLRLPECLLPNIHEWIQGTALTDICIREYSIPMILAIWNSQDFLGAARVISELAKNPERAPESAVLRDGSCRLGSQYLTGETPNGYCMYYFQATERDAYRSAEMKTNSILEGLTEKFGTEPSFEAYAKDLEVNGYQAMEQKALELFNNPNFEYNLNQVLQNQYYGTNVPVNREIEEAVKREMEASYRDDPRG